MAQLSMKKGLFVSLFSLVGCLGLLALLEVGLRVFGFEYPPSDDPIAIWNADEDRGLRLGRGLHRVAARQLWEPRPKALLPLAWTGDPEHVNSAGYRGPLRREEKTPGVLRIATMGDSSTFGFGVPYADTYSAQLEASLNAAGLRAEVLDFGVIGYTLLQGIERYKARVRDYHPDVVIEAFGAVNDHHVAQGLQDTPKIAQSSSDEGALAVLGRRARENLRLFHLLARGLDSMHREDPAQREEQDRRAVLINASLSHVGELDFEENWHAERRVPPQEFEAALGELKKLVEADGASLLVVSMPRRPGVDMVAPVLRSYSAIVVDFCKATGNPLYDGRSDFRDYRAIEHGDPYLFFIDGDDYHPSKRGHARIARRLCEMLIEMRGPH
ncbi:MAG TPA: GDSL-type esterase/lipase family protein [Planctomycetota bacterium]|nr:GDSL-type esterase/lipase family protein [Planctomycetota bacterium]